jgi:hypothetical protein
MFKTTFAAAVGFLAVAGTANAGIVQADITESLDLPFYSANGPRVFSVNNAIVGPGAELTGANEIQNPSGWQGYLDVDLGAFSITFQHQEGTTDYQIATITIDDIIFSALNEIITGVTLNTASIINAGASDPFTETVAFTDNSITITFAVNDIDAGDVFHFVRAGSASYVIDIETGTTEVAEPASLALFGAAFVGLGLFGRRKRKVA